MKKFKTWQHGLIILLMFFIASCQKQTTNEAQADNNTRVAMLNRKPHSEETASMRVFAEGLHNPRGLKFGPDGYLYVAEAGQGGSNSTVGECDQVIFPVGPYKGSTTGGRISKIDAQGVVTTVTDQLPSSQANEIIGGDIEGVADVAFIGNTL